ncbi:MAG: magnesium/cobalt transporter CorA [Sedimentisphaerales bacterium]|nr:magnesium/cobalt transporter CorA [Sedimentisphaerales bacterium]
MARNHRRKAKQVGLPPGTLVHVGEKKAEQVRITVIDYDAAAIQRKTVSQTKQCLPFKETATVTWINIDGLHDVKVVEDIGRLFDLHPLILEDILHTNQRPKIENHERHLFVVMRMIRFDDETGRILSEQFSMVLGEHYLITFQECVGDVFEPIRQRLGDPQSRLRKNGPDYLLYRLMDSLVDHYFVVLEKVGDRIEALQEEVARDPAEGTLQNIHRMRREMISFRRAVWPVRDLISSLQRQETPLLSEAYQVFFNDLYDHIVRVVDTTESYREMISGMLDLYMSSISNKMNAVMKVLTIIATIFIPLTFIAGVYGMNFDTMPELHWRWGYATIWGIMGAVFIAMLFYFKRKKWL